MSDFIDNLNQVMAALQQLQLENEILHESLQELQSGASRNPPPFESQPPLAPCSTTSSSHPYVLKPTISLPNKFNGTRAYLRGFINQIRIIIRLQPQRYASDFSRVELVDTLLFGPTQAWFAPLIENSSFELSLMSSKRHLVRPTGDKRHSQSFIPCKRLTSNLCLRLRFLSDFLRCQLE